MTATMSQIIVHTSRDTGHLEFFDVRMASGQGALGESPQLLVPAFEAGVDYVVCDSLAESTTSTLALDRQRDEALGYAPDLAARLAIALPYVVERGTRLITNAGGVNPVAAHQLAVAAGRSAGFRGLRIGLGVRRDGAAARRAGPRGLPRRRGCGASARQTAPTSSSPVGSPTRRCSSRRWWSSTDGRGPTGTGWLRVLSSATCSSARTRSPAGTTRVTGGTRWTSARVGMPVAEVAADGSAVITKSAGTSGRVSFDTVREQLLYEVHDPSAYVTPDVVADFTTRDAGGDRSRPCARLGRARTTSSRKAEGAGVEPGGWAGECALTYAWPDAAGEGPPRPAESAGGRRGAEARRCSSGAKSSSASTASGARRSTPVDADPPEVTARLAWRTADAETAQDVLRLVGLLALSGPPGLQGIGRSRKGHPLERTRRSSRRSSSTREHRSTCHVHVEEV